jgi:hypothetical protein
MRDCLRDEEPESGQLRFIDDQRISACPCSSSRFEAVDKHLEIRESGVGTPSGGYSLNKTRIIED